MKIIQVLTILFFMFYGTSCNTKKMIDNNYLSLISTHINYHANVLKQKNQYLAKDLLKRLELFVGVTKKQKANLRIGTLKVNIQEILSLSAQFSQEVDKVMNRLYNMDNSKDIGLKKEEQKELHRIFSSYDTYLENIPLPEYMLSMHYENIIKGDKTLDSEWNVSELIVFLAEAKLVAELRKELVLEGFDITLNSAIIADNNHLLQSEKSSIVKLGEDYELTVSDESFVHPKNLRIKINGQEVPLNHGLGKLQTKAKRLGLEKWKAEISFEHLGRDTTIYLNNLSYEVVKAK